MCVFSEWLHQNNVPIDEEKLGLGPFCISFISVTFFGLFTRNRKNDSEVKKQAENTEAKSSSPISAVTCCVTLGK